MNPNYLTRIALPVNKYGNRKTVYDAFQYDSKAEAEFAMNLNLLRHAQGKNRVESWERQVHFPLIVNGEKIVTTSVISLSRMPMAARSSST
jgi:hypothetical protein